MRIVITNPFSWPHVRRGSERFIEELAEFLSGRGHAVIRVVGTPEADRSEQTPHGRRIARRLWWAPAMARLRLNPAHGFLPGAFFSLRTVDADLIHSLYYLDAWLANRTRRNRRRRTLFHVVGPPDPRGFRRIPPDRLLMHQAMRESDHLLAISRYVAGVTEEKYGRRPHILPIPADLGAFSPSGVRKAPRPVILSVASFDERRKGAGVLVRAFARLQETLPETELWLSGSISDERQNELLRDLPGKVRRNIRVLGTGRLADLPDLYRQASLMALPSVSEGFGMVVVESWACGTPVVLSDHGALPELVSKPGTAALFEPCESAGEATNDEGLAEALKQGLRLAERPETAALCREAAEPFSWERLGPRYESFYKTLLTEGCD